jgi:hypothetical protein
VEELGFALEEEQGKSLFASAPTSLSPCLVEAPQDKILRQELTETTGSRSKELQDVSRHSTAQSLEGWKQRESEVVVVVEGGGVRIQQAGLAAQKEELGQSAVGNQQDLVEVVNADDPEDKEATEALPAVQPKIPDEHRFRLRGIRTQPLARRQTETTQYQIV